MLFIATFAAVFLALWVVFYAIGPLLERVLAKSAHWTAKFRYRDYLPVFVVLAAGIAATAMAGDGFLDIVEELQAESPELHAIDRDIHDWAITTRTPGATFFLTTLSVHPAFAYRRRPRASAADRQRSDRGGRRRGGGSRERGRLHLAAVVGAGRQCPREYDERGEGPAPHGVTSPDTAGLASSELTPAAPSPVVPAGLGAPSGAAAAASAASSSASAAVTSAGSRNMS